MIRRPPRSTQSRSSAASDVYKRQVLLDGGEVPAFPEHQRLVHGLLQAEVGLLDVAVLVRLAGLYLESLDPVVGKKGFVVTGELLAASYVVVDRGGEAVGLVLPR